MIEPATSDNSRIIRGLRIALVVALEVVALVVLLLVAARVVIPLAAPPPSPPTPTIPAGALRDCPGVIPGCR